ncbi:MAG TPA: PspC domain-containing protein [Aggregatilineaceae bacterium]|nr:PspC domain-containing protein [Aggregatilineaceae bacterium]
MNPQKRLYRSTNDRMFAGVCGGVAEYLEVDPTLVRLVFVALALLSSGAGFVLYIVLMLIVPEQPDEKPKRLFEDMEEDASSLVKSSIPVPDKNQDDPSI